MSILFYVSGLNQRCARKYPGKLEMVDNFSVFQTNISNTPLQVAKLKFHMYFSDWYVHPPVLMSNLVSGGHTHPDH